MWKIAESCRSSRSSHRSAHGRCCLRRPVVVRAHEVVKAWHDHIVVADTADSVVSDMVLQHPIANHVAGRQGFDVGDTTRPALLLGVDLRMDPVPVGVVGHGGSEGGRHSPERERLPPQSPGHQRRRLPSEHEGAQCGKPREVDLPNVALGCQRHIRLRVSVVIDMVTAPRRQRRRQPLAVHQESMYCPLARGHQGVHEEEDAQAWGQHSEEVGRDERKRGSEGTKDSGVLQGGDTLPLALLRNHLLAELVPQRAGSARRSPAGWQ
mmetsp:Transcript_49438/g.127580  ORF Transcript_49438/g.127580 Transcript_49438/m.127580 type:complete len:266 (-) Transcript_49438:64-861(-)